MKKEQYRKIIKKYKAKYLPNLKIIEQEFIETMKNYDKKTLKNLMLSHRNLIKQLIIDVINEFEEFKETKCFIMLNGSLARGTNTFFSDIDINYFYANKHFKKMINVEEKVNFILQTIMGFRGKDRIHSMVVYLPLVRNDKYESIDNNKYPIYFEDGIIYTKCRENAEELMYKSFNSTRSINDLCAYLNEHDNATCINEWANCFELLFDNGLYKEFIKNRKICKNTKNINKIISNILKSIRYDDNFINDKEKSIKIKDLKYSYKMLVLHNAYEILALYFRMCRRFDSINIYNFEEENIGISKDFYDAFYKYIEYIQKLQFILDYSGMDFSFHSSKIITNDFLNHKYKKLFKSDNIIYDLNESKKKFYNICNDILIKEMRIYE